MIFRRSLATLVVAVLSGPTLTLAQDAEDTPDSKYENFAELTGEADHLSGFLDLYQTDDHLYLVIPQEMIGQDFLMEYKVARGIGAGSLFGGTMLNLFEGDLVALERHGSSIYLVQRPHRFTANDDTAAALAVDLTFGSSVLQAASIESIREDDALVIDVQNWFLSDLSNISQRVRATVATDEESRGNASFDRSRSYLESVRAFPDNINVQAKLTFKPESPRGFPSVPDNRYVPVSIHYTLARLPERPMTPRYGDDRVGNFWTVHKDFSEEDETFFVRMVNRWRLEPGDRVGEHWEPRKSIVYYIDPNVPEEYRATFKEGIEAWNDAFEAAGFVNAIRAEDLPDGADPADIRYATLRWNVSDQSGYGAIGPSTVDPRTGEILDADILFEASMFVEFKNAWRNMAGPTSAAGAFEAALSFGENELAVARTGGELDHFATALSTQGGLLGTMLAARGEIGPGEPVPWEYLREVIKWVVMHEVGHSLGLQHNFRSSASTPFALLHDREWADANGVFSSVMEYPTINLAPPGTPNGYYYNPGIGSYDRWAISYGYTPDADRAKALAREGADKRHMFGTDAEAGGPGALDPTINVYDLSDDPVAWGRERVQMIEDLWADLPEHVLGDNTSYNRLTRAFAGLMDQYAQGLAPAVKYIGGAHINRDHVGDPNARLPFENLPLADQQAALDFLVEKAFSPAAFQVSVETLQQFGSNRWLHWGSSSTFQGRLDYPLHEQVLGLQRSILGQLFHPFRLARIRDAEMKFGQANVITIPTLMSSVTAAIWSELDAAEEVTAMRRDLQRAYLDQMTEILTTPRVRTPADARSLARAVLRDLQQRIEGRLAAPDGDAYTRAHLEEGQARISKALDAGLEAEGR